MGKSTKEEGQFHKKQASILFNTSILRYPVLLLLYLSTVENLAGKVIHPIVDFMWEVLQPIYVKYSFKINYRTG